MRKITFYDVVVNILLSLVALACLIPLINSLAISLSDKTSAAIGRVSFWPVNFTTVSYENIVKEGRFFAAFGVSVQRVLLGAITNVFLIVLTAYPLSKDTKVFRQRNIYIWFVVATMLFSGGLIPSFILIKSLGLLDSLLALVLPGAVPVFSVIILMNFFKGIPKSLEEAAIMDGANPLIVHLRIYVPLSLPSIATVTLFSIVDHWNSFFDGMIFINTNLKKPLATYIQSLTLKINIQQFQHMKPEEIVRKLAMSDLTFNSAKAIVAMTPLLIIYPFLQKYFVTGIVMGAVKE